MYSWGMFGDSDDHTFTSDIDDIFHIFSQVVFAGIFCGIAIFGMLASTYIFVQRRRFGAGSWTVFIITLGSLCALCLSSIARAVYVALKLSGNYCFTLATHYNDSPVPDLCFMFVPYPREEILTRLSHLLMTMQGILPVFSDAMILYRVTALFPEFRKSRIICFLTWLATVGCYITAVALHPKGLVSRSAAAVAFGHVTYAYSSLSLVCNIAATASIGLKFWSHRRYLSTVLGRGHRMTSAQRVLAILTESGATYCALQLAFFITMTWLISDPKAPYWMGRAYPHLLNHLRSIFYVLSGLYPATVFILCYTFQGLPIEKTLGEADEFTPS